MELPESVAIWNLRERASDWSWQSNMEVDDDVGLLCMLLGYSLLLAGVYLLIEEYCNSLSCCIVEGFLACLCFVPYLSFLASQEMHLVKACHVMKRVVSLWGTLVPQKTCQKLDPFHDCGHRDFYDLWSIPQKSAWSPWCFGISLSVFEFIAADSMVGLCPTAYEDVGINTLQCMVCTLSLCDSSIDLLRISVLAVIEPRSHTSDVCMARGGFKI